MKNTEFILTSGGENVFRDLDLEDAETLKIKSEMVSFIEDILQRKKLNIEQASKQLSMKPKDLELLLAGDFAEHSVEDLLSILRILNQNIEITISPNPNKDGIGNVIVLSA